MKKRKIRAPRPKPIRARATTPVSPEMIASVQRELHSIEETLLGGSRPVDMKAAEQELRLGIRSILVRSSH